MSNRVDCEKKCSPCRASQTVEDILFCTKYADICLAVYKFCLTPISLRYLQKLNRVR